MPPLFQERGIKGVSFPKVSEPCLYTFLSCNVRIYAPHIRLTHWLRSRWIHSAVSKKTITSMVMRIPRMFMGEVSCKWSSQRCQNPCSDITFVEVVKRLFWCEKDRSNIYERGKKLLVGLWSLVFGGEKLPDTIFYGGKDFKIEKTKSSMSRKSRLSSKFSS